MRRMSRFLSSGCYYTSIILINRQIWPINGSVISCVNTDSFSTDSIFFFFQMFEGNFEQMLCKIACGYEQSWKPHSLIKTCQAPKKKRKKDQKIESKSLCTGFFLTINNCLTLWRFIMRSSEQITLGYQWIIIISESKCGIWQTSQIFLSFFGAFSLYICMEIQH